MAGSAAQRELHMAGVPIAAAPPTPAQMMVGTQPLAAPNPSQAGWPSMLFDATNPIFDTITTLNSEAVLSLIRVYATNPGPPPAWSGLSMNCLGIAPGPPGPGGANVIVGNKNGTNRWLLMWPNTENENGGNSGSNVTIHRYDDNGIDLDIVQGGCIEIFRSSGQFQIKNGLVLGGNAPATSLITFVTPPVQAANDAAAAAAGVPVNGVYLNGSAMMMRVT